MFSSSSTGSWSKLKTNLRLAVNRLKLLEKKKTELTQKARKEIADYIQAGKCERAKIRVEHIVREDYIVEAMEIIEMYCDLLLARFGLIQQMKTLDAGLAEAISSLIWVAPRLQSDVGELHVIAEQLTAKYGKQYALACRDNAVSTVNEKLMHKMGVEAPPKVLVERYLIEIAKSHGVAYEPDPEGNKMSSSAPAAAPPLPTMPPSGPFPPSNKMAFQYQTGVPSTGSVPSAADDMPVPSYDDAVKSPQSPSAATMPSNNGSVPRPTVGTDRPVPAPRSLADTILPELPTVPADSVGGGGAGASDSTNDDVDFDDLAKRFEALKKKK